MYMQAERQKGEFFLGNFTEKGYRGVGGEKRKGKVPLTADGGPYPFYKEHGVFPVFVQKKELQNAGVIPYHGDICVITHNGELVRCVYGGLHNDARGAFAMGPWIIPFTLEMKWSRA